MSSFFNLLIDKTLLCVSFKVNKSIAYKTRIAIFNQQLIIWDLSKKIIPAIVQAIKKYINFTDDFDFI